jgi:hypothetical protein
MTVHRGKNVIRKIVNSLIMDIMFDFQEVVGVVVGWVDRGVPDVLGVLDQSWRIVQVSFGVQVEVCS